MSLDTAPPRTQTTNPTPRPRMRAAAMLRPIALAIALTALIVGYVGADLYRDRADAIAGARDEMAAYTRLLAQAMDHALDAADVALMRIADQIGPDVDWSTFDPAAARDAAERHLRAFRAPIDVVFYDDAGRPRFSYRRDAERMANLGDQPFFEEHRRNPHPNTIYGIPFVGPTTGTTITPISRRLSRADGSFAGVAVAGSLDVLLEGFYRSLELENDARATLLRSDGILLWRQPPLPGVVGRSFADTAMFSAELVDTPSGTVVAPGRLTDGDVVYAYRRLEERPLVVTVGLPLDTILAPWRSNVIRHVIGLGLVLLAIAWVTTRRILADSGLRRSNERLRSILSTMAEGLLVIRTDGTVADANPAAVAILGIPFDRLLRADLNRNPLRLVDADGRPVDPERSGARAALRTGEARSESIFGLLRDGAPTRWLSVNTAPIHSDGGSVEGAVVTFSDVTERYEAERQLKQSRQRLAEVFDVLAEGVTVRDGRGAIIDVNPAAETILGRPREQIIGAVIDPDQTLPWTPVDESGAPISNRDNPAFTVYTGRQPIKNRVIGIHRPDGSRRWIAVNNRPSFDADGNITVVVSSFADVTDARASELALRESQQRHAAIVNSLAEGVIVRDARGVIIDANPAAVEILGRPRADLLGLGIDTLLPWRPVDENGVLLEGDARTIVHTFRSGEGVANRIIGVHRPDGTRRWLSASSRLTRDENGGIALAVSSFVDITDQRRMANARDAEHRALELAAENAPLPRILEALCRAYERDFPTVSGSIMLADRDAATLRLGAAPSLPPAYCAAFDGLAIGPDQGSCGAAAFRRERVIVADIAADPLWAGLRGLAAHHGLAACWSTPLFGDEDRLIGTFAVYSRTPRQPTAEELAAAARLSKVAAVAIDRARSREALQQSEALYRSLVETIPDGVMIVQDERFAFVNAACAAMAGAAVESMIGRGMLSLADPRDHALIAEQHRRRMAGEAVLSRYPVRVRRIDGGKGPIAELHAVRIMYRGRPATLAVLADVTEQREIEAKLRESEARFRDFARSSSDWYWELDADLRFSFVLLDNEAHAGLVGTDFLGRTRREVSPLGVTEAQWAEHEATLAAREPFRDFRLQRLNAAGAVRTVSVSGVPTFDDRGTFTGYRGVGRDVTAEAEAIEALRRSREQLASTINAMAEGLIVRRPDLTIVEANAAAVAILGTSREALIGHVTLTPGRPMLDQGGSALGVDDRPSVVAIQTGASVRGRVISLARPDGVRRWLSFNTELARRPDGTVEAIVTTFSDISDQRESERALRESEERFRRLVEFLPTPLLVVHRSGRIVDANAAAGRLFDAADRAGLVGRSYDDIVDPADLEEVRALRAVRAQGQAPPRERAERRYVSLAGRHMVCEIESGWIAGDASDEMMLAIHDVTDRREAERAVRDYAERLQLVTDNIPMIVSYVDVDERVVFINRFGAQWYAAPPEAIVGKTLSSLLSDDAYAERRATTESLRQGRRSTFAGPLRYPDGRTRWVEAEFVPHISDGVLRGTFAFTQDVTARREAERAVRDLAERLQLVTDHLPLLVGYVDLQERMQFINRTGARWFGRPAAEIVGRRLDELFDQERYERRRDMVRRALAGELVHFDGSFVHPDGTVRRTESTFVPHVVDGAVRGYFGFTTDVTDRLHTEEQLRQAQKMEAVGQLTGGIAHDFNNLLAIVMGNLELLADNQEPGSMPAALTERALRATRRGAELTRRLLAFSRRQALQPERLELNALVAGLTDLLSRTLGENIRVETRLADDVGAIVVDPGQLENALLNLAVNARDAMPRGGRLLIETANVELDADYVAAFKDLPPGPYAMLAVSDTGEGMAPEIAARAFEPFFTTKEAGKGSGLGLSMVYGFVKQSGGHVVIYSEQSLGTTIRLYLPRMAAAGAAPRPVNAVAAGRAGSGQNVVVVEDDPDVRQLVASQLAALGYAVRTAASGREAMALIADAAPIDLLLTDVVLAGGMSGVEIVARARQRRPGLRVLYMSGYTEGMINEESLRADDAQLLQKPFARTQLAQAVRTALEKRSKES